MVVIVSVVVWGSSVPSHEQQGSPVLSLHLSHSKDPPCATQALMFLSSSQVGTDDVDGADVEVAVGVEMVVVGIIVEVDELVLGHWFHWHLFSY